MKLITANIIALFTIVLIYVPLRIWKHYNNKTLQKILNKL